MMVSASHGGAQNDGSCHGFSALEVDQTFSKNTKKNVDACDVFGCASTSSRYEE